MTERVKPAGAELRKYISDNIDRAVSEGWIAVFYQPVARTLTGEICGMEALARWIDPDFGLLSPFEFIGALEETKLIYKLDSFVIQQICRDYARFTKEGVPLGTISFNLSRLDFKLCDIHQVIEDAIKQNKVPRDALRVEITESTMDNDGDLMHNVIDKFWDRGLRVWMDDFGSGYSSLNVLKDYHFDTLKIDMVFLRNFDPRSREIIKSVVDMSKRLGIHTLAEGVETEEQFEFLKSIGCEKAQGYWLGKPMPFEECYNNLKDKGLHIESPGKRNYYRDIGKVNLLSASPMQIDREIGSTSLEDDQVPIAFVEYAKGKIRYLFANESYKHVLASLNINSTKDIEDEFEEGKSLLREKFTSMFESAQKVNDVVTLEFTRAGMYCYCKVRAIADYPGGKAFICFLQTLSDDKAMVRRLALDDALQSLCAIYDLIILTDLEKGTSQSVYSAFLTSTGGYHVRSVKEDIARYAEESIFPDDKKAYLEFSDMDTLEERVNSSPTRYISATFRTKTSDGTYVWMLYSYLPAGKKYEHKVLTCVRRLPPSTIARLYNERGTDSDATKNGLGTLSSELLWDNFVRNSDTCFFWKDTEGRFLGANRKFIEYFALDSVDDIIGKTTKEMGWLIDYEVAERDSERVLKKGEQTYLVPSSCVARGEVRKVTISMMPIYRNGAIVGLMGYFLDITDWQNKGDEALRSARLNDTSGTFSFLGLVDSIIRFEDGYNFDNQDFALIQFKINNLKKLAADYGREWCENLSEKIVEKFKKAVGNTAVVSVLGYGRFEAVYRCTDRGDVIRYIDDILNKMDSVITVDGTPCAPYYTVGYSMYSECRSIRELIKLSQERLDANDGDK